jgi:hypothetical protein
MTPSVGPCRDGHEPPSSGKGEVDDLGTQLEDLIAHVFRCERWARMDDQIALSVDIERLRRPRRSR